MDLTRREFMRISASGIAAYGFLNYLPGCRNITTPNIDAEKVPYLSESDVEICKHIMKAMIGSLSPNANAGLNSSTEDAIIAKAIIILGGMLAAFNEELPNVASDISLALMFMEYAPIFSHFGRFSGLSAKSKNEVLGGFTQSDMKIKKDVFMGIKSIFTLVYYEVPEVIQAIGYQKPLIIRSAIEGAYKG